MLNDPLVCRTLNKWQSWIDFQIFQIPFSDSKNSKHFVLKYRFLSCSLTFHLWQINQNQSTLWWVNLKNYLSSGFEFDSKILEINSKNLKNFGSLNLKFDSIWRQNNSVCSIRKFFNMGSSFFIRKTLGKLIRNSFNSTPPLILHILKWYEYWINWF